jgi:hypothetical protein
MTRFKLHAPNTWLVLLALSCAAACGDNDTPAQKARDAGREPEPEPESDAEVEEQDAGEPDCYEQAKTYVQIINACTDAERVQKDPELPQLLPDGTLPPLP